jgi:hypothetical protein
MKAAKIAHAICAANAAAVAAAAHLYCALKR